MGSIRNMIVNIKNVKGRVGLLFVLLTILNIELSFAQLVSTPAELQSALSAAAPGSEIILKDQVWTSILINIDAMGTQELPVIIKGETPGGTFIEGNSSVTMGGAYIIIKDLIFRNPSGLVSNGDRIDPIIEFKSSNGTECNNCTLTNLTIDGYNGTAAQASKVFKWIYMFGQNNEISYCSFLGKNGVGSIINDNRSNGEPNFIRIHHNYFANRTPAGDFNALNDQDAIRIGTSTTSMSDSYSQVYDNYFNNWFGEIEIISNKSGKNKYFNNTFRNFSGTLTLRHGNDCEVYDNYFFADQNTSSGGIRVIGEGHTIYNNYIEGINSKKESGSVSGATGGINVTNGRPNSELNGYFQVVGAKIVNNTFVNCDYGIRIGTKVSSDLSLPPVDIDVSNNIMLNTSVSAVSIQTEPIESGFRGNITQNGSWDLISGTNGNEISASGLLEASSAFYRIIEGSDAIDAGLGDYDFLSNDILGGIRETSFDAGVEELGANGTRLPYTDADVGVLVGFGANIDGEIPDELSASVAELKFTDEAGAQKFYVLANVEWTITSDASWLTVDPVAGENSVEITATAKANSSLEERTAIITISQLDGAETTQVSVSQTVDDSGSIGFPIIPIASVTGVGTQEPNIAENTLDKDDDTRWSGESSDGSAYLYFNFIDFYNVAALRMKFHKGDERSFSFKLQYLSEGALVETEIIQSSGTTLGFETFELSPMIDNVSYLIIAGYGNSGGSDWNSYVEVEIYGDPVKVLSIESSELSDQGVKVYPNPVKNGLLKIESDKIRFDSFQVYDTKGQLLINQRIDTAVNSIDVHKLTSGIYVLIIPGLGQQKFIIKRE